MAKQTVTARKRRWLCLGLWSVACLASLLVGGAVLANWLFPLPPQALQPRLSQVYYDRHGRLLGAYLAPDDKWRFASRLQDISPYLVTALLEFEDKRFYRHVGIDVLALARAAWQNLTQGRIVSGASTITMQVARLISPQRRYGTPIGKLVQALRALQLEWYLSKSDILTLYFTLAPYGKNIEGVTAASWLYFRKPPSTLHWTEAIALAIAPKSPNAYRPDRFPRAAQLHCQRLVARLRQHGHMHEADAWLVDCTQPPGTLRPLPRYAPHLLARLHTNASSDTPLVLSHSAGAQSHTVYTTIDLDIQQRLERTVTGYLREVRGQGIRHAAVLVLDNASAEAVAYIGSPDFHDKAQAGEVDGVRAQRSPGSTLKPFLYARALESGQYTPQTLLSNVPMRYPGYHPQNFTPTDLGVASFSEALQRSLNLPAVALNVALGPQHDLLALLWEAGVSTLPASRTHYGQSLVLGGGEMRLDELTTLYAALAHRGTLLPTRLTRPATPLPRPAPQLLTPEASFIITAILRQTPLPGVVAASGVRRDIPDVAWKTGTSSRRRDAWTVGYNSRYTVGVWVGNFTGESVEQMTGQSVAAPLFWHIFRQLPDYAASPWPTPPERLLEQRVCRLSGRLPTAHCPAHARTWWIAGVTKPEFCQMHVQLLLDRASGQRLSEACVREQALPSTRLWRKPAILWPREVGGWLAHRDATVLFPPYAPGCVSAATRRGLPPLIQMPVDGEHYALSRTLTSPVPLIRFDRMVFAVAVSNDVNRLDWFLDGKKLTSTRPGETYVWRPQVGEHALVIVDDLGRTAQARFTVHEQVPQPVMR